MATEGPKVSNGIVSNNPDFFTRADPDVNNKYRQVVRLDFGTGTGEDVVSAVNPLPVTMSGGGGPTDTNITEVGGVAVTLGQKAEAASIPVVLATEQDTAITDATSGLQANLIAVTHTDINGTNTRAWPCIGDTGSSFYPGVTLAALDATGAAAVNLVSRSTTPNSGDNGLVTRNIPSGTQTIDGVVQITPSQVSISGTITTSTSTVTLSGLTSYGGVCISIRGTYAGVNFTPEASADGVTYNTVSMSRQDTPQLQQSSGALTNTTRMWIAPTMGCAYFRVRATAWTSGTATIALFGAMAAVPTAVQTLPSGTQTITGTVTANPVLNTSGGGLPYKNIDLNATGVLVKTGKTYASDIYAYNDTGATIYVKVYNKATAATSADTPIQVYGIATKTGECILGVQGIQLGLGYSVRCTTGVADADNTSPAANGCVFSTTYT